VGSLSQAVYRSWDFRLKHSVRKPGVQQQLSKLCLGGLGNERDFKSGQEVFPRGFLRVCPSAFHSDIERADVGKPAWLNHETFGQINVRPQACHSQSLLRQVSYEALASRIVRVIDG